MASLKKWLALGLTTSLLLPAMALAADNTPPSDVENLAATPGDEEVTLTWDAATDDTALAGYFLYSGLTSVTDDGGEYTFGATDTGDVVEYTMEGLTNGVTYYFAVTAYDEAGNESEFYSFEVEATPEESETGDSTAPTVTDAQALTSTLVEVEFSESVDLPSDATDAFTIEALDGSFLEVLDAYVSSDDDSVVFVVTETQDADEEYTLTAGIAIEDMAGNPVESGTSDTAIFDASSLEGEAHSEDDHDHDHDHDHEDENTSDTFELTEVEATDLNELKLSFTQEVIVADADSIEIANLDDATDLIEVSIVEFDEEDPNVLYLVTEEMEPGAEYLLSLDESLLNELGESLDPLKRDFEFTAKTLDIADLIPPEDVANFLASIMDETTVNLSWDASVDSAGDLAMYLVYQSTDGISFSEAVEVAKDFTSLQVDGLTPGATYTFKVTAKDENDNESEGVLTVVTLPETGPGLLGLAGLSLAGAGLHRRRKKRQ